MILERDPPLFLPPLNPYRTHPDTKFSAQRFSVGRGRGGRAAKVAAAVAANTSKQERQEKQERGFQGISGVRGIWDLC